jgi:excisionase family DNA binding protein
MLEAARLLGIGRRTVTHHFASGRIKGHRVGGVIVLDDASVRAFLRDRQADDERGLKRKGRKAPGVAVAEYDN